MSYSITAGNEEDLFKIDASFGTIKYSPNGTQRLDFEHKRVYSLIVQVTDDNSAPLQSFGKIDIEIVFKEHFHIDGTGRAKNEQYRPVIASTPEPQRGTTVSSFGGLDFDF